MEIFQILTYGFIQKAIITGALIGILCSALGTFLVLKKFSMIGDGLAHITFASIAFSLLARFQGAMITLVSLPIVILCSLGILKITVKEKFGGDTAIAIVSSVGIALSVLFASLSNGFNADLFSYLFGNILSISTTEMLITFALFVLVVIVIKINYRRFFILVLDEELAKTSGLNVEVLNYILVSLTAVTVLIAMRLVGIMLISALLVLPSATALQFSKSFKTTIIWSGLLSLFEVIFGILFSVYANLPSGACIVLLSFGLFLTAFVYNKSR